MLLQYRAGPFPNTTHTRLSRQFVAVLRHRHRVPVFESYVLFIKFDEEIVRIETGRSAGEAAWLRLGRWRFLHAVIEKVPGNVISTVRKHRSSTRTR